MVDEISPQKAISPWTQKKLVIGVWGGEGLPEILLWGSILEEKFDAKTPKTELPTDLLHMCVFVCSLNKMLFLHHH